MKLIQIRTESGPCLGIVHYVGRIERVLTSIEGAQASHKELIDRIVNCVNACDGLSDDTMKLMANGGTPAGNLVERAVAWSMLFSNNKRLAHTFLEKARAEIAKLPAEPI